jgi:hypothetical protein
VICIKKIIRNRNKNAHYINLFTPRDIMSDVEHLYTKTEFAEDEVQLLLHTEAEEHLHLVDISRY